jgi:hypothetical protein
MKLQDSEQVWAPPGRPELWTVVPSSARLPLTLESLLGFQAEMGRRLTDEASRSSLSLANEALEAADPALGTWDRTTPDRLLASPPSSETLTEWRADLARAARKPQPLVRTKEAIEAVEELTLDVWAANLLQ